MDITIQQRLRRRCIAVALYIMFLLCMPCGQAWAYDEPTEPHLHMILPEGDVKTGDVFSIRMELHNTAVFNNIQVVVGFAPSVIQPCDRQGNPLVQHTMTGDNATLILGQEIAEEVNNRAMDQRSAFYRADSVGNFQHFNDPAQNNLFDFAVSVQEEPYTLPDGQLLLYEMYFVAVGSGATNLRFAVKSTEHPEYPFLGAVNAGRLVYTSTQVSESEARKFMIVCSNEDLQVDASAKLIGYFTMMGKTDDIEVTVKAGGEEVVAQRPLGEAEEPHKFVVAVPPGNYRIDVTKPGYITWSVDVYVRENKQWGTPEEPVILIPGDLVGWDASASLDGGVSEEDIAYLRRRQLPYSYISYDRACDFNDDGMVDVRDIAVIIANYNKWYTAYGPEAKNPARK